MTATLTKKFEIPADILEEYTNITLNRYVQQAKTLAKEAAEFFKAPKPEFENSWAEYGYYERWRKYERNSFLNCKFEVTPLKDNPLKGKKVFKKCVACHSIAKGGSNKIGPALWGVLGRKAGSVADYKYSKAMAAHGKSWSVEEMNGFLIKPKEWIKGTKMSFAGLKNAKDRAAVILYMNKNTDSPLPLN